MKDNFNYKKVCEEVLSSLPPKSRVIIEKRFGLGATKRNQTLQQIGDFLGITRERVRQIESDGLNKLRHSPAPVSLKAVFAYFERFLEEQGGFKREDVLLAKLSDETERAAVSFLLRLSPKLSLVEQNGHFYAVWFQEKDIYNHALVLLSDLVKKLTQQKAPQAHEMIYCFFNKENKVFVDNVIEASCAVEVSPLDQIGLAVWPEIKPRGARDIAYLMLKKTGQPLHFRDIANKANDLPNYFLPKKKTLPQTVHNELIRDPQFILVGRGVYGLKEWGYQTGTVREVIKAILVKNKEPLARPDILQQVLRQRMVQPNTIFLNLNNKKYFQKDDQGRYGLKEI
ncbi:MAG: HTH domain-containing protein [Candidatus Gribaldobacteria bacterium]|nr:HTH domain-containing protein [Candidatus Gribaldobacteria bacterium]